MFGKKRGEDNPVAAEDFADSQPTRPPAQQQTACPTTARSTTNGSTAIGPCHQRLFPSRSRPHRRGQPSAAPTMPAPAPGMEPAPPMAPPQEQNASGTGPKIQSKKIKAKGAHRWTPPPPLRRAAPEIRIKSEEYYDVKTQVFLCVD